MKRFIVALLVSLILLALEFPLVRGYVLYTSDDRNGSLCRQPNPMQITYYNSASASDQYQVPLAAEAWNDVPVVIHFSATAIQSSAAIIVNSTQDASLSWYGLTYNTNGVFVGGILCSSGNIRTPVAITINDYVIFNYNPGVDDNDLRIGIIAHEMGHSVGLAHSPVRCSLMQATLVNQMINCGVYFPVVDDDKGAAALYGWAKDTNFASFATHNGIASGTAPPLFLEVSPLFTVGSAQVSTATSLPASNLAIMMAYVQPSTLYRFHIGWEGSSSVFAVEELDNDGAKLVYAQGTSCCAVQNLNSSFTPQAGISYFLELVVYRRGSNAVATHAYVYQGSFQTGNGGEQFDGHSRAILACSTFPRCAASLVTKWTDAVDFDSDVWTDTTSNPSSSYDVNHFWNFQGSSSKPPLGDFSILASPASVSIYQGNYASSTITLYSFNDFIGNVSLSVNWGTINYMFSAWITQPSLHLSDGGSNSTTLNMQTYSYPPTCPGTYAVSVSATFYSPGGNIQHGTAVSVTVTYSGAC